MLTLGLAGWLSGLLTLGFLIVCVVMILIVLIQRPQGGGLGGAFGSAAGSGQTAFGAKTGDALTIATIGIFVIFLLSAIGLNFAARPSEAPATPTAAVAPEDEAAAQLAEDVAGAGADTVTEGEADAEPAADDAAEPATDSEAATETDAPAEGG
ncbi:MAG: preprotein translocase subunit SecG [Planctomycetota bacterium]